MVDLHIHSTHSDGVYTPRKIIEECEKNKVEMFSITDHNNIDANYEVLQELAREPRNIKYFTGSEVTCQIDNKKDLHILCHNFDLLDDKLKGLVNDILHKQNKQKEFLVRYLKDKIGIECSDMDFLSLDKILLQIGKLVSDKKSQTEFKKTWREVRSQPIGADFEQCAGIVHKAGGITSLAHPFVYQRHYKMDDKRFDSFIGTLAEQGLDAIEAFNPTHGMSKTTKYREIARRHGLKMTAGSDFHSNGKKGRQIGTVSSCGVKVTPHEIYDLFNR